MTNSTLEEDYLYCKKIIFEYSKTFSIAFSVLPKNKEKAIWSLYAFNRLLDDIVDTDNKKDALLIEQNNLTNLKNGIVTQTPIYRTLKDVDDNFGLDYYAMNAMFEGQFQDLDFKEIVTEDDLLDYCYNVAGSVGHMLLPVVATKNKEELYQSAKYIGMAMQITNILRDIGEDYNNNRVYIPTESLERFNVNLKEDMKNGPSENYIKLWENYAKKAEEFYQKGLLKIELYDDDSKGAVKAAAIVYKEILNAVRKQKYDLNKRAVVPKTIKIKMLRDLVGDLF